VGERNEATGEVPVESRSRTPASSAVSAQITIGSSGGRRDASDVRAVDGGFAGSLTVSAVRVGVRVLVTAAGLVLASASCSGGGGGEEPSGRSPTTVDVPPSQMDPVLAAVDGALGCDSFGRTSTRYAFGGESTRHLCAIDGKEVAVVEIFAEERRNDVIKGLGTRYEAGSPMRCDGLELPGPWTYVGRRFAVTTYREVLVRRLAVELDGVYVGGGATPDEPLEGPPVSYDVPC